MTDLLIPLLLTAAIILLYPLVSVYLVVCERKVLADFQVRLGPMRVGPHGLLQPLADALKLVLKEDIIPREADKAIFWIAPVVTTGAIQKIALSASRGMMSSLRTSFSASASGCNRPWGPTRIGPSRT